MGCRYVILDVTDLLPMMMHPYVLVCSTLLFLKHHLLHSIVLHYHVTLVLLLLFESHEGLVALKLLFPHLRILLVMSCLLFGKINPLCDSDILHIMIRILHVLVLLVFKTLITNLTEIIILFEYLIHFALRRIQVRQKRILTLLQLVSELKILIVLLKVVGVLDWVFKIMIVMFELGMLLETGVWVSHLMLVVHPLGL